MEELTTHNNISVRLFLALFMKHNVLSVSQEEICSGLAISPCVPDNHAPPVSIEATQMLESEVDARNADFRRWTQEGFRQL